MIEPQYYNRSRVKERTADELIGICKGVIADGVINDNEAVYILKWLESNKHLSDTWIVKTIYNKLSFFLEDGVFDEDERSEFLELLQQTVSGNIVNNVSAFPTSLPLDSPPPHIIFQGSKFCFTGNFAFGSRADCHREIEKRSGKAVGNVSKSLNYLVIGTLGSPDWIHSTYGRKIEAAVKLRQSGTSVAIIHEDHWAQALDSPPKSAPQTGF